MSEQAPHFFGLANGTSGLPPRAAFQAKGNEDRNAKNKLSFNRRRRSSFLATPGAPTKHPDKQGRRSEHGGVEWGGATRDSGPGTRGKTSTTSIKGRGFRASPTRRRPSAEQRRTSKDQKTFNRHNRPILKTRPLSAQRPCRRHGERPQPEPKQPEDDCFYKTKSTEFPPPAATTPERKRNRGASFTSAIGPSTISAKRWPYPGTTPELFTKRLSLASRHSQLFSERGPRTRF